MFENVGKTIKSIAKWVCYFLMVASIITGGVFVIIGDDLDVLGYVMMFAGPLFFWLSSLFVYGFGEIVDTAIHLRTAGLPVAVEQSIPAPKAEEAPAPVVVEPVKPVEPPKPAEPEVDITPYLGKKWCGACGRLHDAHVSVCSCGSRYLGVITKANALNIIPNIAQN